MIPERIRERYLRDPLPIRLGGLAADLARIASFAGNPRNHRAVASLLEESKYFAEWAAPDAPLEIQEQLAEVQVSVALWQLDWENGQAASSIGEQAQRWSNRLLELSGLAR